MADLPKWLAWAETLDRIYVEELGRSSFSDREAFVNWTYHWREERESEEQIRAYIRTSPEWLARQGQGAPPAPETPRPVPPPPPPSGGRRRIQVTDASDGILINRGYSYYSQVWVNPRTNVATLFVGSTGGRPLFFQVDRATGAVSKLGALLPYTGEGEGWYFGATGLLYLLDGPRLRRIDPFNTGNNRVVLDISQSHPDCDLWQAHSSDDGDVHSATVRQIVAEGKYPYLGTVVQVHGHERFYPAQGTLDESQVSGDGNWLLIKEDEDNRLVDLKTGGILFLKDQQRALGHSDVGPDYAIGEADKPDPGMCVRLNFPPFTIQRLFETTNMGHVCVRNGRCLLSDDHQLAWVDMNGGGVTHITDHGMVVPPGTPDWKKYDFQVEGNLDSTATVACYLSNHGGERLDLFFLDLE